MRSEDFDAFEAILDDLCVAFGRPKTPQLTRVFFESLKHLHILDLKRAAELHRRNGKRFPTPKDLTPERHSRPSAPARTEPELHVSRWAITANRILFSLAYFDRRRGFHAIAEYPPPPPNGHGPIWGLPKATTDTRLRSALVAKADYVRMAEEAEAGGESWDMREFIDLVADGLERILETRAEAA